MEHFSTTTTTMSSSISCDERRLCQHGATCVSTQSGYYCVCTSNYTGANCGTQINTTLPAATSPDDVIRANHTLLVLATTTVVAWQLKPLLITHEMLT